jgi:hypothetical protein
VVAENFISQCAAPVAGYSWRSGRRWLDNIAYFLLRKALNMPTLSRWRNSDWSILPQFFQDFVIAGKNFVGRATF